MEFNRQSFFSGGFAEEIRFGGLSLLLLYRLLHHVLCGYHCAFGLRLQRKSLRQFPRNTFQQPIPFGASTWDIAIRGFHVTFNGPKLMYS